MREHDTKGVWRVEEPLVIKLATRPDDVRVARIAGDQEGVIATRQLRACGLNSRTIAVRVRRGNLHPVFRGVYAVGHRALTPNGLFIGAVLVCGDDAVLAHDAAAVYHRMQTWRSRDVDVIVPRSAGRAIGGIRAHRSRLDPRDVWIRSNIRVTSPARTILDLAATRPFKPLRRLVRQAQAERTVNVRQLLEVLHRYPHHRGAARLRAVIADGPTPTKSDLEDLALDLLDAAAIPRPEVNPKLTLDDRPIFPDLLWPGLRLAVELDSRRWHHDPLTRQDDADKQAILEAHGYRVLRITWRQIVDRPQQTLRRIRTARGDS